MPAGRLRLAARDTLVSTRPDEGQGIAGAAASGEHPAQGQRTLDGIRREAARDLVPMLRGAPRLIEQVANGNTSGATRAVAEEQRLPLDPDARAVKGWKAMQHARKELERAGDKAGAEKLRVRMEKAAGRLHRDLQLEAAPCARAGAEPEKDRAISEALGKSLRPTANAIGD